MIPRVYFAAPFATRAEVALVAAQVCELCDVVSTWHAVPTPAELTPWAKARALAANEREIQIATHVVALFPARRGVETFVEIGLALGQGKRVIVVDDQELFSWARPEILWIRPEAGDATPIAVHVAAALRD